MQNQLRPNQKEIQFLTLAYNRFYDIFAEVMDDSFWDKNAWYRFSKVKDGFGVYSELINYEPLRWVLDNMKIARPPMEAEIARELFKFIRNIITHFPFFDSWKDVWVNKSLVNWLREGRSIDRFIRKYMGKEQVKYRFWEEDPSPSLSSYLIVSDRQRWHCILAYHGANRSYSSSAGSVDSRPSLYKYVYRVGPLA